MSGIDYDILKEHTQEVKLERDELSEGEDTIQHFYNNEVNSRISLIRLYALSVPLQYFELFMDTVHKDFKDNTSQKLGIDHLTSFADVLKTYQHLFFGEEDHYVENRSHFVEGSQELSIIDNFGTAISNYALLIGYVDNERLELYKKNVLRANEINRHFVSSVSNGLVAILQNLSMPNSQVFISEAFELTKVEEGFISGLYEAGDYITLKTESSIKRFNELLGN